MAKRLVIAPDEVLKIARLSLGDAEAAADVDFVIEFEQEAIEDTLDGAVWNEPERLPLLRRGVAKLLAAETLEMRSREEGASGAFQGAGVSLSNVPDHAAILRSEARAALAPYRKKRRQAGTLASVATHSSGSPASLGGQARVFGRLPAGDTRDDE